MLAAGVMLLVMTRRLGEGRLNRHVRSLTDREGPNLPGFSMDYSEAVAYLDAHIGLGGEPGLDRIRGLLDDMGGPHLGYPMIHVAGTNGKTSTTRFATLLCLAHGLSTGTCISPHLQRIEERFAADGHMATEEEFALAISDVAAFAGSAT